MDARGCVRVVRSANYFSQHRAVTTVYPRRQEYTRTFSRGKLVAAGSPARSGEAGSRCYRSPPTWRPLSAPARTRLVCRMNVEPRRRIEGRRQRWQDIKGDRKRRGSYVAERLRALYLYGVYYMLMSLAPPLQRLREKAPTTMSVSLGSRGK